MEKETHIAILIPCYNEEKTVQKVIEDFKKELPQATIYVYDNNSDDQTSSIARMAGAIVRKEPRQGKGNVIRSMFREIEADLYIMVDGDDTYPASFVHELIQPVLAGDADMVIGDRLSNQSYFKGKVRPFHSFGNRLVRKLINRLFRSKLRDIMTGYRVFNPLFVKNFPILSEGFEIETEMSLHALDKRFKIVEIPISYQDRPEGSESKLNTFSDGFKVILTIFSIFKNYRPLLFFGWIGCFCILLGILIGIGPIREYIQFQYVYKVPSAILATGLMLVAVICFAIGFILDSVAHFHRSNYELNLLNNQIKSQSRLESEL